MKITEQRSVRESREQALSAVTASPFIGNVVAAFVGLNRAGERDRLDDALAQFGGLFAYLSETQGEAELREELRFVDRYLRIQEMRFAGRFQYRIRACGESPLIRRFSLFEVVEPVVRQWLETGSGELGMILQCPAFPGGGRTSARLRTTIDGRISADMEWTLERRN